MGAGRCGLGGAGVAGGGPADRLAALGVSGFCGSGTGLGGWVRQGRRRDLRFVFGSVFGFVFGGWNRCGFLGLGVHNGFVRYFLGRDFGGVAAEGLEAVEIVDGAAVVAVGPSLVAQQVGI